MFCITDNTVYRMKFEIGIKIDSEIGSLEIV
jgi:hypothetical protein